MVTTYTWRIRSTSSSRNRATVMPVSSMATGDIQLPAVDTALRKNWGMGSWARPSAMPSSVQINMGLTKFFIRWPKVCFPLLSANRSTGTPHR